MIAILLLVVVRFAAGQYLNDLDQHLHFTCPSTYQSISYVHSVHDNYAEDRRFIMTCRDTITDEQRREAAEPLCYWTGRVNNWDQFIHFKCPDNNYINGMDSIHDDHTEDRRWRFHCCTISGVHLFDCRLTSWTNSYDKPQYYSVPAQYVMTGVISQHDNYYEDRQYEYEICKVEIDREPGIHIVGK